MTNPSARVAKSCPGPRNNRGLLVCGVVKVVIFRGLYLHLIAEARLLLGVRTSELQVVAPELPSLLMHHALSVRFRPGEMCKSIVLR